MIVEEEEGVDMIVVEEVMEGVEAGVLLLTTTDEVVIMEDMEVELLTSLPVLEPVEVVEDLNKESAVNIKMNEPEVDTEVEEETIITLVLPPDPGLGPGPDLEEETGIGTGIIEDLPIPTTEIVILIPDEDDLPPVPALDPDLDPSLVLVLPFEIVEAVPSPLDRKEKLSPPPMLPLRPPRKNTVEAGATIVDLDLDLEGVIAGA